MTFHSKYTPLSYSSLKSFSVSPAHFLSYKNRERKDTPAMAQGRLIHKLVLEEDLFLDDYSVWDGRRAGKVWNHFKEANLDKQIIKQSELNDAINVKNSVFSHSKASELLSGIKATEKYFKGTIEGVEFHGFIDGLANDYILDLKTTISSEPHKFQRDSWNMKYHLQAAIYCRLMDIYDYYIIAVEKNPPYAVSVFKLDTELLEYANSELEKLIQQFKEWRGENNAYDHRIALNYFHLQLPEYLR